MSYKRVLPRDLFNEAKLLKCLGQLALLVHDGICPLNMHHTYHDKGFRIEQEPSDGSLFCTNVNFWPPHKRGSIKLRSAYNSKDPYPLALVNEDYTEIEVFDDEGNLTDEFLEAITPP